MRTRRPSPEHEAAVARRLAALVAELEATRPGGADGAPEPTVQHVDPAPDTAPALAPSIVPGMDELDECETTVVRLPGRHAARRRDLVADLEEAGSKDRWLMVRERLAALALAPAHLAVVAALVAGGLAVTCWWVVASDPQLQPVAAPVPVADRPPDDQGSGSGVVGQAAPSVSAESSGAVATEIVIDVAGKVRRPGIVVLPSGSRVVDALEAAGGARRGVDLKALNLARPLVDGEQILVGVEVPAGVANGAVSGVPGSGGDAGLVNINLADQTLLESLPGVGPVTAAAIIAWRTDNGGFRSVDDLLEVSGIGEATLAKMASLVTL